MRMIGARSLQFSILLSFQVLTTYAFGQTYYVSSAGNDANNGTSTLTPWQTITKVNNSIFTSGSAIYFRGGDKFYGQIDIKQAGVTVGAYEAGIQKPVITGAVELTGWTVYSGSIYVAQASSFVKNLYANGAQMTLARFPNTGFMLINSKTSSTTFSSSGITQSSGYWNGANCRLRTNGWTFESPIVSTQSGTTIVLASAPRFNTFSEGWGFYLDNKLAALDTENEWYCDPNNNKVYFYAPGGVDPNVLSVYGSTFDYGVNGSSSYITVENLEFNYQVKGGLRFTSAGGHINILSNTIYGGLTEGIHTAGPGCTISNNTIQNVNGNGIQASWGTNCVISNNTLKSVGTVKGYQSSAMAYGILSEGTYATISSNYIDSTGYDGIYASAHDLVEKNIIKNTMLILSDGGAIYTGWGSSYVTIRNNIISGVTGSTEGTDLWGGTYTSWSGAEGIYLDSGSDHCDVYDNTIMNANSRALKIGGDCYNHTVRGNNSYNCGFGADGFGWQVSLNETQGSANHIITRNSFCAISSAECMGQIYDFTSTFRSVGTLDSNNYVNAHGSSNIFNRFYNVPPWKEVKYTSFSSWQALTGAESHSRLIIPGTNQSDTIFVNSTAYPMAVNLPPVIFYDLDNNSVVGSFILDPFSSRILIRDAASISSAITVNPASLSFGDVAINTSSEKTYTLSGSELTPADGNITVTDPSNDFQVSLESGSGFVSSLTVPYTGGTLSPTTIYVRFSPAFVSGYAGDIMNSGGGVSTQYVAATGMGVATTTPTLTVNPISLFFGNVVINTVSSEKIYTLTGSNLSPASGSVTIAAPAGYQVSVTSGSGYSSSVDIPYSGGALSSKTIYVRFSPIAAQSYTGNITHTVGATIKNVAVIGSGISNVSPVIAINPGLLEFSTVRIVGGIPSSERIYTLQGSYLSPASGNITINAPIGYEVSLTSGSDFSSSLNVPYSGGALSVRTIYVRFYPSVEQFYTGSITNEGGGATAQSVAVTGRGISNTSAALTVIPTTLSFGDVEINTTSSEKSFGISGLNLSPASDSITIQASVGFTISTQSGTGFTSLKRIAYTGGRIQPISKTIYVRFSPTVEQNYNGIVASWGGTSEVQTVSISGKGIPPPQPSLTVEPASLSFGNVANNTISSEQTYILEGSNLSPLNGSITITAPAGFQVSSATGSGFDASITISYSGGVLPAKTIYGRFLPTALQSYSGNITNTGGGAADATVSVSGSGAVPTITVTPKSLPFSSVVINTISSERTIVLSASNLTPSSGEIIVTAPSTDFQVSLTTGSGFSSSVTIPYSGGAITTPQTIFARFLPAIEGGYSGKIKSAGGGATTQVTVSGIGVLGTDPLIAANPTSLFFENVPINMTSSQKTYTLSAINLSPESGNLAVTAPSGFQVSKTSGAGFDSSLTFPFSGGTLTESTVYVRFYPTATQIYAGNIANTGGGAAAESIYVSGSSIAPTLTMTPDSLPFGSVIINTSSIKTYTLSGSNLYPADDTVKITAPIGFTVSTGSDSGFNSSVSIPYTANSLSSTPIHVKFTPAAVQSYRDNISHFCGGVVIRNLPVSGESVIPLLTISSPSVNFGNVLINTTSAELTYKINGLNLTPASGNIIVKAPYGFEVSVTSGLGFNSSINIPYINGVLSSTIIYIRFSPLTAYSYIGSITNDGGGAATQSVAVNGIGINAASLYVSTNSLSFGSVIINSISSEKLYTLSGVNLTAGDAVTITSSKGLQVSTTSGAGFDTTISISLNSDTLSLRFIYVRFSPAVLGDYFGTITNAGGGAQALNITVNGDCLPLNKIVQLGQNYPNPFNPTTRIPYSIHKKSRVKLTVFNILGQQIRTLIDEEQDAGFYQQEFDISRDNNGQELSSGVYFYRLEIAGISVTKKLILLK